MRPPSRFAVVLVVLVGALPLGAQQPAATGDSAAPAVAFFGEVRTRSEYDRPVAPVAPDAFTYLRSRFGARVDVSRGARVVLQVQDSRVLGARANGAASDVFALHQGYLELSAPWRGVTLAVRAGRQEIALGNERLVGAVAWSNTGRALDGARVSVVPRTATPGAEPWTVTAFAATVEERGAPHHVAVGLFATRALAGGVALDGTLLHDAGSHYRAYEDARRTTLDARIRAPRVLGLSAQLEGAVQLGTQRYLAPDGDATAARAQEVRGWLLGARVGTPASPNRRASAGVGVDVLSGDADPTDGGYGAFNTILATNHPFYGLMDVIGEPAAATKERGLVDALVTGSFTLSRTARLAGELHHFALATGRDRPLGWEVDVTLPVRVRAGIDVAAGYSAFRAASGAAAVGLGADGTLRHWAYVQLKAGF